MAEADAARLLGTADATWQGRNGDHTETYIFDELVFSSSSASASARDLKVRCFSVLYGPGGHVIDTWLHECRTPAQVYQGQAYAGPEINQQDVNLIQIGATTEEEIEQRFGCPLIAELRPGGAHELHWFQILVGTTVTSYAIEHGLHVVVDGLGVVRDVKITNTAPR